MTTQAPTQRLTEAELQRLQQKIRCLLARQNFYDFCRIKAPDFYTPDRWHLRKVAEMLELFYRGLLLKPDGTPYRKLMLNMPPQHGKSRTLTNFCAWVLGQNQSERIITCSYNDSVAGDFSKYVRDGIAEQRTVPEQMIYNDIFPQVRIKYGTQSAFKWALEGQHFNYLGSGLQGTITGKGGSILIIDDPVKNDEEAFNEDRLEKIWNWYIGTFLSRVSSEGSAHGGEPLEIIVMTRWSNSDICGKILASDEASQWYVLKMQAFDEQKGTMLCPSLLGEKRYRDLEKKMLPEIFNANYKQEPINLAGQLYKNMKTYDQLPVDENGNSLIEMIKSYTDTADEGNDYLCTIVYGIYGEYAYVLDVQYTQEPAEVTEQQTAEMLLRNKVNVARIESNNGGRYFARNVKRIMEKINGTYDNHQVVVRWFHQSKNKIARIVSQSATVQEYVLMPRNWQDRFPHFYNDVKSYVKGAKNKHDDASDTLTGVAENIGSQFGFLK